MPRQATVISSSETVLAYLDRDKYKLIIERVQEMAINRKLDVINTLTFFKNMGAKVKKKMLYSLNIKQLERGQSLINEGEKAEYIYFIVKGEFKVTKKAQIDPHFEDPEDFGIQFASLQPSEDSMIQHRHFFSKYRNLVTEYTFKKPGLDFRYKTFYELLKMKKLHKTLNLFLIYRNEMVGLEEALFQSSSYFTNVVCISKIAWVLYLWIEEVNKRTAYKNLLLGHESLKMSERKLSTISNRIEEVVWAEQELAILKQKEKHSDKWKSNIRQYNMF